MSASVINDLTPTRKRKRDSEKFELKSNICFTNTAFSSTPKKISGRRRLEPAALKENQMPTCMEVKSIAELVKDKKGTVFNPYEVQRKPPKKKKREAIEDACFENPALNLNVPEKQFNPFEVVRDAVDGREEQQKCFVNEALNIRVQDSSLQLRNPFEIQRGSEVIEERITKESAGVENPALEDATTVPTSLKIGIPFTPTVGCRIDFNNVPLSQLTPNKLLLTEKLVFSPTIQPKRSLDTISEESSSTSFFKELDRYQLELENSINEAKLRKNDEQFEEERVYQLQLKVEKRVSLNQHLTDIPEGEETEVEERQDAQQIEAEKVHTELTKDTAKRASVVSNESFNTNDAKGTNELKEDFLSEDEGDDHDFKAPAPFVRSYRRDFKPKLKPMNSKESLNSENSNKSLECIAEQKHHTSVKGLIRRSIRKIMPHHKQETENPSTPVEIKITNDNKGEDAKQCTLASHIMSSIRHSLRRKPKTTSNEPDNGEAIIPMAEISIIDTSERNMKLKSSASRNDYARIEELTTEKKHLLRNGSLRRSMMKTLFHKQEEYSFKK